MKRINKKELSFLLVLLPIVLIKGQSVSVFDANYFNKDNTTPPIKIGKGFHINDIYMQTRHCFTQESSAPSNLVSEEVGGKKTSIKMYYTKSSVQYNQYRSQGNSGKVSFLNLFSIDGSSLEQSFISNNSDEEHIIFTANVDFGRYTYDRDLELTPEAKELISKKDLNSFIKVFGTHYISGIRKESNIKVILTRTMTNEDYYGMFNNSVGFSVPFVDVSGTFETKDANAINERLSKEAFTVSIEINGPTIDPEDIKIQIQSILTGNSNNKVSAINSIISGVIGKISNPSEAVITQYYYAPFSLYGLDGLYWDEKKQNELIEINKTVVNLYAVRSRLADLMKPESKKEFTVNYIPEPYSTNISAKYDEIMPNLERLSQQANDYLLELEKRYMSCSNVFCQSNTSCCSNMSYLREIGKMNFEDSIRLEVSKVWDEVSRSFDEMNKPECEKRGMGQIIIKNLSSNPYYLYNNDNNELLKTMQGNSTDTFFVENGTYNFKAVQKFGYLMYPTVNLRTATILKICDEVILKIGFE